MRIPQLLVHKLVSLLAWVKAHALLCSLGLLVVITVLSLTPLPQLPEMPGTDKLHHFIAYAALMFPVAFAQLRHRVWLALGFFVWSGSIELIQPMVNRYGEWLDLAANGLGLLLGYLIAVLMRRWLAIDESVV
ncbi:hypothetical protein GCM10008090_15750 [Arenicella chitinivorans]|uniref:VanZ-like domain-containing protein n=1 Tax=Arenicella chitinivorans TaxID=1329800 RepID=A0A918RQA1_9GAMM|nr:VanZ family protein [Arenicella chitinivorans]GHA06912.1 hypothetical protein GCM10008090_15750 [Arenicella chitinivorans]